MEYLGYVGALFIGLVLGLTGGGGSILTVPILVYIMGFSPVTATAYSLFIVGTTAAFGTIQNYKNGIVNLKMAVLFAIPSLIAVFITRKFIVPAIPEIIFKNEFVEITKNTLVMVLFAVVMLSAALSMLKVKSVIVDPSFRNTNPIIIVTKIFLIGILIGLVGAGGGFIIIPVLVFMVRLPMKQAIGTSLLIIAINSLIGFTGDIENLSIDWSFLLEFTLIAVIGIFLGIYFTKFIKENQLKKGFGWFVLVMSIFIFIKELMF